MYFLLDTMDTGDCYCTYDYLQFKIILWMFVKLHSLKGSGVEIVDPWSLQNDIVFIQATAQLSAVWIRIKKISTVLFDMADIIFAT